MPEIPPRDPFDSDPVGDAARGDESVRATLAAEGQATRSAAAMDRAIGHVTITEAVYICEAATLTDGGKGVRMNAHYLGHDTSVFFVRFDEKVYGYLNQCAHVPMELDWNEGQFFDDSGLYLICSTHGAIYTPESGRCVGGPCRGAKLRALQVEERETPSGRAVYWLPDDAVRPVAAV
jgi:nitrite reductase/ring-hydroxylating ferredoxin subunit